MSTTLPRYMVTDTGGVGEALLIAEKVWPGLAKSQALVRLITMGARQVAESLAPEEQRRQEAVARLSGYSDAYPAGYLDRLRAEWDA
ncbi:MAG: hypothetical protein LBN10_02220 [Propionibacteriaceae bacterium]|nr:hypothetical protein [Propionibacteriaceae bacterium]